MGNRELESKLVSCSLHTTDLESDLPLSSEASSRSLGNGNVPRIVLAEDDAELRSLMAEVLRSAGYDVIEVCDGVSLRGRLTYSQMNHSEQSDIDLIVSDIRMPGLNGLDALADVGGPAALPPIILITAFGDQQTFLRASRLGAAAFFDKPVDLDKFCAFVADLLKTNAPARIGKNGAPCRELDEVCIATEKRVDR